MNDKECSKLISDVVSEYQKAEMAELCEGKATFLSVIGKDYHETYLSRIIAYCMIHDEGFIKALVKCYCCNMKIEEPKDLDEAKATVNCEENMGGRRADIFAVSKNPKFTITLENKVYSEEHDDQTSAYYDWVTGQKQYNKNNGYLNCFFYLRPGFNSSKAVCKEYVNLNYTDICKMLSYNSTDPIIIDLIEHIRIRLESGTVDFKEYELNVLKNFDFLKEVLDSTIDKVNTLQLDAIDEAVSKLDIKCYDWCTRQNESISISEKDFWYEKCNSNGILSSYRFFRPEWYVQNKYYFYVEILFKYGSKYGDIRGLCLHETAKVYNDSRINDYLTTEIKDSRKYKVIDTIVHENFSFEDFDIKTWKTEFIDFIFSNLPNCLTDMDRFFAEHKEELLKLSQ